MKFGKSLPIFLVLVITLLSACSSGGGKTATVMNGVIELEDARLDFGENVLPDSAKAILTVVQLSKEEMPEGLASNLYELELDVTCTSPVTISIPLVDSEKPEDREAVPMIGLGSEIVTDDGSKTTLYAYIPAQLENNKVTATFVPADYMQELKVNGASGGVTPSKERMRLGIFWCSTTFVDGGHFIVNFPAQRGSLFIDYKDRTALLSDLEGVYDDYLSKGFTYAKRSSWPMEVNIQSMTDVGYYSYGWSGADGKIYLNRSLFEGGYQISAVKSLMAHEFFHFVQLNYSSSTNDCLWFDEATATYFEGQAGSNIPSIVAEYNEKIFSGVFPEVNSPDNGYARMPLIKFLANKLGEGFILNTYTAVSGGTGWDSAITATTGPAETWAADFYQALVKGEIGSYTPYTLHSNLTAGERAEIGTALALQVPTTDELNTIVENDEIPLLAETTLRIASCGAQLVAFTIDDTQLFRVKEGTDPIVTVGSGAEIRGFAVRGSNATTLKSSGGSVKLDNFKKSSENKTVFLALVTGLHKSGVQDYKVKVELPPYPTLDELVGRYKDGVQTITEVYISPELQASAESKSNKDDNEMGCDINMLNQLKSMVGVPQTGVLIIAKTGEDTGTLTRIDEDGDSSEPISFTYMNSLLIFESNMDGLSLSGDLIAAYGKNKDVTINGDWRFTSEAEDLRINMHVTGTKPLPGS